MSILNTNIDAMKSLRMLNNNNQRASKTMEKLSSGLKLNHAADDSAGMSISGKMRAQIRGLEQATRNVEDADSLVATADGALSKVQNIIHRIRELTVQAGNDTNSYTTGDRTNIQVEIEQLTQEIDNIYKNTEFNTRKLFDGSGMTNSTKNEMLMELHAEMARMLGSGGYGITSESCVSALTALLVSGGQTFYPPPLGELGSSLAEMNYTWVTTHSNTYMASTTSLQPLYVSSETTYTGTSAPTVSASTNRPSTINCSYSYSTSTSTSTTTDTYGTTRIVTGSPPTPTIVGQSSTSTRTYTLTSSSYTLTGCQLTTYTSTTVTTTPTDTCSTYCYWPNLHTGYSTVNYSVNRMSSGYYMDGCHYFQPAIEYTITTENNGVTGTQLCTAGQTWSNSTSSNYLYMLHPTNVSTPQELHEYIGLIDKYVEQLEHAQQYAVNVAPPFPSIEKMIESLKINKETAIHTYVELELIEAESRSYQSIYGVKNNTGLWIHTGANTGQGFWSDLSIMNSETLGIGDGHGNSKVTVDTPWYYENTGHLNVLDYALDRLSKERSKLGATQNRLDQIKLNLGITTENQQSALSRIEDADIAKEHMALMIANVLQNASTAMLAQANSKPETILQLFR